jgi:hypothetical protein
MEKSRYMQVRAKIHTDEAIDTDTHGSEQNGNAYISRCELANSQNISLKIKQEKETLKKEKSQK